MKNLTPYPKTDLETTLPFGKKFEYFYTVQPDAQLSLFEDESERMAQSSDDTEITLVCSARRGYPEAKVHWEVNGKRLEDFYRTVEDHGLFTAISALHLPLTELDHVKCIVDHPAFPTPKMYVASDAQFLGNGNSFF